MIDTNDAEFLVRVFISCFSRKFVEDDFISCEFSVHHSSIPEDYFYLFLCLQNRKKRLKESLLFDLHANVSQSMTLPCRSKFIAC